MSIRLTDSERSRLRGMTRRPRSRKQLYRAEAILSLDEGQPIEAVARRCRVGVERVESWVEGFTKLRIAFLDEPSADRPAPPRGAWPAEEEDDGEYRMRP